VVGLRAYHPRMRSVPSEILPAGTQLDDKYRVVRHIKSGGMGAVYEVEHVGLGKHFAAKVLLRELLTRPKLVERFRREARAASATGHENIVEVTDLGETDDGVPFLIMELLRGRTLGGELKEGRFECDRAVHIARQILAALDAAHARGIVHRDLKPENIFLIQRANDADFVKVLDFGIAKLLDDSEDDLQLTETGQVVGTPSYMAPEQARGDRIDQRIDVYATGAMLYRMVTGQRPFAGANLNALLFAIAEGKPPSPRSLNPLVSAQLEEVITRSMSVDLARRYPTAAAMSAALLDDDLTADRGPGRLQEPSEDSRTGFSAQSMTMPGDAGPATAPRGKWMWVLVVVAIVAALGAGAAVVLHSISARRHDDVVRAEAEARQRVLDSLTPPTARPSRRK